MRDVSANAAKLLSEAVQGLPVYDQEKVDTVPVLDVFFFSFHHNLLLAYKFPTCLVIWRKSKPSTLPDRATWTFLRLLSFLTASLFLFHPLFIRRPSGQLMIRLRNLRY